MLNRDMENIHFDLKRCVQCGTCLSVCPQDALKQTLRDDGLWEIICYNDKCNKCFKCISVCPSHSIPKIKIFQADLDSVIHLYLAHATDSAVRRKASSGGAARVIAQATLESGLANSVYSVAKTTQYPWAEGKLWTQTIDISQLANSMYLPVLVNKNLDSINGKGIVLLIGTTCQLLASEKVLKGKCDEIYKIAIFCKQQKKLNSTCFIAKRLGLDHFNKSRDKVEYRSGNWPGIVKISDKTMKYETAADLPYGKRLWRVPGCRLCPNPFGFQVDLTLADPWGIDKTGGAGNTLIVVWTPKGRKLLDICHDNLEVKEIDRKLLPGSVTWKGIRRKRLLTDYYLGKKTSLNIKLAGLTERLQTTIFEKILELFSLPNIGYKIMARFPDLTDYFLKK